MSDRAAGTEFVFGRHAATDLSVAYAILVPQRRAFLAYENDASWGADRRPTLRR